MRMIALKKQMLAIKCLWELCQLNQDGFTTLMCRVGTSLAVVTWLLVASTASAADVLLATELQATATAANESTPTLGADTPLGDSSIVVYTNDDGAVNIADPVYSLNYQFAEGPSPPEPFPGCGDDPTPDDLDCGASQMECP